VHIVQNDDGCFILVGTVLESLNVVKPHTRYAGSAGQRDFDASYFAEGVRAATHELTEHLHESKQQLPLQLCRPV